MPVFDLKVLIITPNYPPPPGGIQSFVVNLEKGLQRNNIKVKIIEVNPYDFWKTYSLSDIIFRPSNKYIYDKNVLSVLNGRWAYTNAVYRQAKDAITNWNPDIIHVSHINATAGLQAAMDEKVPSVLTIHAKELEQKERAKKAINSADAIHTVSDFTSNLVQDMVPSVRPTVIHPSIKIEDYRAAMVEPDRQVVCISRLAPGRKNVESIIRAWKLLSPEISDNYNLIIVGDGPRRKELEELSPKEVDFTGWVSEKKKKELLGQSKLFVFTPARYDYDVEGFGIVYIEAQAAGTPVIGSGKGGSPEAIGNGGIIVNNESNPNEIAENIEDILNSPDLWGGLTDKALDRIRNFDWEPISKKHIMHYQEILEETMHSRVE